METILPMDGLMLDFYTSQDRRKLLREHQCITKAYFEGFVVCLEKNNWLIDFLDIGTLKKNMLK